MGGFDSSVSPSNLFCQEDMAFLKDDDGEHETSTHPKYTILSESEDEYIETLISKEGTFRFGESLEAMNSLRSARSVHIQWVLKMKGCFRLGCQTIYLAVAYFDRFLTRRTIIEEKIWAVRLLSIACLSLAVKMEEVQPLALSKFRVESYHFDSSAIMRMELLVLNTLEWRMRSVTPFPYLGYFASKLQGHAGNRDFFTRAIGFIFAVIRVMNSAEARPSIVAAAAILAASSELLTEELVESKISITSLPESLVAGHVFSCYSLMIQESQKVELNESSPSENCAAIDNSVNVVDTVDTASRFKRRKLQ